MGYVENLKIHHIGYAVKDIDKSIAIFRNLGYVVAPKSYDKERKVIIAFAEKSQYLIELISPLEEGSPVDSILRKNGSTPYHICYEVDNIETACCELKKEKFRPISESKAAPAIQNANVIFLYNPTVGLIELVEKSNNQ